MEKNKYSNGKIYGLYNKNTNELLYIGSTVQKLYNRMSGHRMDYKRKNKQRIYQYINSISIENVKIILIENYPCENIEQLHKKEQDYQEKYKYKIYNKNKAFDILSYKDMKQYQKEYQKEYRNLHNDYNKIYRFENKSKYVCNDCDYSTSEKTKLTRHLSTIKHKKIIEVKNNFQ